jgi:hypothetical protein
MPPRPGNETSITTISGFFTLIGLKGTRRIGGLGSNAFMPFKNPTISLTHNRTVINEHDTDTSRRHETGPAYRQWEL